MALHFIIQVRFDIFLALAQPRQGEGPEIDPRVQIFAFTGARESREGLLRSANGGMLFLDEIGELGADEQAMLLKAIEEKTFYPFGSDRQVSSDFQLIAGTVRDLRQ